MNSVILEEERKAFVKKAFNQLIMLGLKKEEVGPYFMMTVYELIFEDISKEKKIDYLADKIDKLGKDIKIFREFCENREEDSDWSMSGIMNEYDEFIKGLEC